MDNVSGAGNSLCLDGFAEGGQREGYELGIALYDVLCVLWVTKRSETAAKRPY
jgi:hypothetical protein